MGYTKLFEELVKSSIWAEDDKTRIVWITMLAMKDRDHFVRGTEQYLTAVANVTPDDCRAALLKLSSPDPRSRSTVEEGRRIKAVPGGWTIINGEYYAQKLNLAERKEYKRQKEAEYRKRKKLPKELGKRAGAERAIREGFDHGQAPEDIIDNGSPTFNSFKEIGI